jgi:hypothetical protein
MILNLELMRLKNSLNKHGGSFYQNKNPLYYTSSMIQDGYRSAHPTPQRGEGWARDGRVYEMWFCDTTLTASDI